MQFENYLSPVDPGEAGRPRPPFFYLTGVQHPEPGIACRVHLRLPTGGDRTGTWMADHNYFGLDYSGDTVDSLCHAASGLALAIPEGVEVNRELLLEMLDGIVMSDEEIVEAVVDMMLQASARVMAGETVDEVLEVKNLGNFYILAALVILATSYYVGGRNRGLPSVRSALHQWWATFVAPYEGAQSPEWTLIRQQAPHHTRAIDGLELVR